MQKTLYIKNRRDWHQRLKENHRNRSEIWLIYYKKQIIYWILDAKRPETTLRRIAKAVMLAEDNVRSAMG